jgi:hypothetical protein
MVLCVWGLLYSCENVGFALEPEKGFESAFPNTDELIHKYNITPAGRARMDRSVESAASTLLWSAFPMV